MSIISNENSQRMLQERGSEESFEQDLAAMDPPVDTDAAYHAHPGFNQSTAVRLINESPRHAFEYRRLQKLYAGKEDPKHTREREIGTVAHKLLLGSTRGYFEITGFDDYKKKDPQETRARCEREGLTPILSCDLEKAVRCANGMREQLREEFGIELDGLSELEIYWTSERLECKAKLDHLRADGLTILDLKTGDSANPKGLIRRILDQGYHIQAACYTEALEHKHPSAIGLCTFIDVFIETGGLIMCTPVEISGALLELGQRQWQRAKERWWQCTEEGRYPGYVDAVVRMPCPLWALEQEMGE